MSSSRRATRLRRALPQDAVLGQDREEAASLLELAAHDPERRWMLQELVDGRFVTVAIGVGPAHRQAWLDFEGVEQQDDSLE